jgi:hypothetical protein
MLSIKSNTITEGMIMTYIKEGIVGLGAVFLLSLVALAIYFIIIYSKPPKNNDKDQHEPSEHNY